MNTRILDRDRLSVLSGALVLGLALGRFFDAPIRSVGVDVLGSPLGINLSATTIMLLLSAGLGATAVESLVRSHPLARQGQLDRSVMYWIMPALLLLGLAGWLLAFEGVGVWTAAIVVSAILTPLALAAEYANVDPEDRGRTAVRWGERALIYLVAFLLYSRIYDLRVRALLSGTAIFAASSLLAARYLWFEAGRARDAFLYGASAGLLLGLMSWAVNYWSLTAMQGGLLLLVVFYGLVGLIQQSVVGRFSRQAVLEYGIVLLIGLLIVILGPG
ncbi:MAG TPA: hypothetical protein VLE70_16030 [Anaerolineae bacterium]|jgi:hypothetical protein|nr:hypothetical protein [Anaerolineae bacterium]